MTLDSCGAGDTNAVFWATVGWNATSMMALIWDAYVVCVGAVVDACTSSESACHAHSSMAPLRLALLAADVGVLREAVDVVVDAVGVPDACVECGEGTSDGPGPLQPLPGFNVV